MCRTRKPRPARAGSVGEGDREQGTGNSSTASKWRSRRPLDSSSTSSALSNQPVALTFQRPNRCVDPWRSVTASWPLMDGWHTNPTRERGRSFLETCVPLLACVGVSHRPSALVVGSWHAVRQLPNQSASDLQHNMLHKCIVPPCFPCIEPYDASSRSLCECNGSKWFKSDD
jgi:hypothetical protein